MRTVRLTKKDTEQPIWVNIDRIAAIEAAGDGGALVLGVGLSAIWVEEFPSDIFSLINEVPT